MYNPHWFKEDRLEVLQAEIRKISFGTVTTVSSTSGILASHVPMTLDSTTGTKGTLLGHIARANPQWRETRNGSEALVIFLGPNAYITPRWYETKKEDGRVVPTWNYVAIHARGPITFFEDETRLREAVTKLTDNHESSASDAWQVDDAPADFISAELRSIVGFEIPIARIEGKWKMSQNRSMADRAGVIAGLTERNDAWDSDISAEMQARENSK